MPFGAFVTLAALPLVATPPPHSPALGARAAVSRRIRGSHDASAERDPLTAYSLRARRRFAAYLRMRLLEMREAGLERAAGVVERRLPVDALLKPQVPRSIR